MREQVRMQIYLLLLTLILVLAVTIVVFYVIGGTWARIDRGMDQIDNMIAGMGGHSP